MAAEYERHWLSLGLSLTEAEAKATHLALTGCPVKTPALRHVITELEHMLARYTERGQDVRDADAEYARRVRAARERQREAE